MGQVDELKLRSTGQLLGVDKLFDGSLMNLSNGQQRRARIVKALLHDPEILLLEEPYSTFSTRAIFNLSVGLDVSSRKTLSSLLSNLAQNSSPRIILALREQDHIPSFITHVLKIDLSNQVLYNGPKSEIPSPTDSNHSDSVLAAIKSRNIIRSQNPIVADLKNVTISYWGKPVLQNINWTVREGDHWLLLGPNGSGKTTLLSLLTGDNPKSFSQDITIFERKRGTGESIFDIQANIGHVSPELHYHFPAHRSAKDAILSGFSGTFSPPERLSPLQQTQFDDLIRFFEDLLPDNLHVVPFRELSTSHQRLILLLRAFVKVPRLLILDEPYQGMDEVLIQRAREYLETMIDETQAVVMVTHFVSEEAAGGRWGRVLRLNENGKIEEIV
jgi:molybdate transport system ATP-binding protein